MLICTYGKAKECDTISLHTVKSMYLLLLGNLGIYTVCVLYKYSTIKDWIQVDYSRLNSFIIVLDTWIIITFISVFDSLDWVWTLMTWTTGSLSWPGTPVLTQSSTWVRYTLVQGSFVRSADEFVTSFDCQILEACSQLSIHWRTLFALTWCSCRFL